MQSPYLATKPFEKRYEVVAEFLEGKIDNPVVADINCGQPLFKNHIKYKEYFANDVHIPVDVADIKFERKTDSEVDYKADVLCVFGYGGGEFTNHPKESKTTKDSILRMVKHKPRFVVIESARKWQTDYQLFTRFDEDLTDYKVVLKKDLDIEPNEHYHDKRMIRIYELI